jgi:hypothetical protein
MVKSSVCTFFLTFSLFCFSFSTFSVKGGVVAYLALFVAILLSPKSLFQLRISSILLAYCLLFQAYVCVSTMLADRVFLLYFIKFQLLFVYVFLVLNCFVAGFFNMERLDRVVKWFVGVHGASFLVQFIVYMTVGKYIDFNNFVREEYANTAYMSRDIIDLIVPIRCTGFFSEPSFYAMTVLPSCAFLIYRGYMKSWFVWLGLITTVLSLSVAAFAILIAWFGFLFITTKGTKFQKTVVFGFLVLVVVTVGSFSMKRAFDSADYDALGARLRVIKEVQERDWVKNLFGNGYFVDEHKGNGVTGISAAGIRDSGLFLGILYSGGIAGIILFFLVLFRIFQSLWLVCGISILLLFKFSILSSGFWVFAIVYLSASMAAPKGYAWVRNIPGQNINYSN